MSEEYLREFMTFQDKLLWSEDVRDKGDRIMMWLSSEDHKLAMERYCNGE